MAYRETILGGEEGICRRLMLDIVVPEAMRSLKTALHPLSQALLARRAGVFTQLLVA